MNEYVVLLGILAIICIQGVLLWKCLSIEHAMVAESTTVQTGLGKVGSLLEEVLDTAEEFFSRKNNSNPAVQSMAESIPEMILGALMNKIAMPSEHASQESQDRPLHEIDITPTLETEV